MSFIGIIKKKHMEENSIIIFHIVDHCVETNQGQMNKAT